MIGCTTWALIPKMRLCHARDVGLVHVDVAPFSVGLLLRINRYDIAYRYINIEISISKQAHSLALFSAIASAKKPP